MSSKILDDMRDVMRRRHYSIRTERSYCGWVKRFVIHFNMKSRNDMTEGEKKIERYLTFLARDRNVAPSTQNQALNALVFLYKHVLKQPLRRVRRLKCMGDTLKGIRCPFPMKTDIFPVQA